MLERESNIYVVKRDGTRTKLDLEKIQNQVRRACNGISDVSPSMIEISAKIQFEDGMTTETIDSLLLHAMVNLIDNPEEGHTNYQFVAGRQRLAMLRKEVYKQYDPLPLYEIVKKNIEIGLYTSELLNWYTEEEWNEIESFIDHEKDEKLSHAAIEQLIQKYLIKNRATGQVYESPQIRYVIAAATAFHMEKNNRLTYVREYYNYASNGAFSLSTPVLAGLGTNTKQFSSCVLISAGDSLKSIYATGEMLGNYASKRAGIGLDIGRIRSLGSEVRNGEVVHTGIVPFLKKWFADLRATSQGGIRNASMTVNCPIFHYQFDDFIVLKNNQGTDENRIRQLDYYVVLSAFFWRRFQRNESIAFFDPHDVPDLYDAFYNDISLFEKLYVKYENTIGLRKKVASASVVFKDWILKERTDTGRIYLFYIDNVINHTPFDVKNHPILQTNLCCEIVLPEKSFERIEDETGRISLCTLGSCNYGKFKHPAEMAAPLKILVRALSNILSYQDFLSIQSKLSNEEFEPLGIGITNLAYWHAKRGLQYGTPEALAQVKKWMEHQAFYLTEATVELAKERGPCKLSHTTSYGKGIFPWEKRAKGSNDLTDFTPSTSLDWEGLREKMIKYGVRNATLMAVAPVESSSICIDSTNGIELPMSLISVKESKAGSFVQVVPGYANPRVKNNYQLMWDQQDCIDYIKTAAVIAAYCDQSISTNTFYSPKFFEDGKISLTLVAKNLMLGHYWGLCSFYYSLIEKQGIKEDNISNLGEKSDETSCESCVL